MAFVSVAALLLGCSLVALHRPTVLAYQPLYGNNSQVLFNLTGEYRWFPNISQVSQSEYNYFISELNFDAISGNIVTGAADMLYQLDMDLGLMSNLTWETNASQLSMCTPSTGFACRNHIRVYKRIPGDPNHLLVCGTQAAVNPQCRTVSINAGRTLGSLSTPVTASNGLVSYYPEFPGFGEFRASGSSDSTYFAAGFFSGQDGIGRHFSLSYQNVTVSGPNTLQTAERFRTIRNNNYWLRFPVTFVDYYRADYPVTSPATSPEHYQFYFVFLRENLFDDSSSDIIYSRVVRICRNDPGSTPDMTGASHFTTYMKARIYCEREVPSGREFVGALDYQYNDISSMVFNDNGRYYGDGTWVKTMYGAFSGPGIGPVGSAVCAYRADNSRTPQGSGGNNRGIFDIFRSDIQVVNQGPPLTMTEEENRFVECNSFGRNAADSQKVLIVQDVRQIGENPLLVLDGIRIVQMAVDQVCVVRRQNGLQCVNQDVLFLGTDAGKIMKVVFGSVGPRPNDVFPVIAEEIALEDNNTINRMNIMEVNSTKYLFVTTSSRVYRLPVQRCSRHTECSECIGSRDPYCVWNSANRLCEVSPLSATDDMPGTVPATLNQNIHTGQVPSVCNYPEIGIASPYYRVNESAGSVDVVVMATSTGLSGYVMFQTEDSNATAGTDYTSRSGPVNFSAGQNVSILTIGIQDDNTYEGDEVFVVTLRDAGVGGVTITQAMATVIIVDDDVVTMEFESSILNVSESDCYANVTVVKRGSTTGNIRVAVRTVNLTARAGEDYVSIEEEICFNPEENMKLVLIPLINNQVNEPAKYFTVSLMLPAGQPGVQLGGDTTRVTVMDDDVVTVQLARSDFTVEEGSGSVAVQLTKSGQTASPFSVILTTANGSAEAPDDYIHPMGGVRTTFAPTDNLKTVNISITDDSRLESTELFYVSLVLPPTNQVGSQIGDPATATVTITDDDSVMVGFQSASYNVTESNSYIEVGVVKQGLSDVNVTVLLRTEDRTARAGCDYSGLNEVEITFGPAIDSIMYQIPITNDEILEAEESFTVLLSVPSTERGVVLGQSSATVVITDDDSVTIGFKAAECATVDEDDGLARFNLVKNGSSAIPVSVWFSTANRTATASDDFVAQTNVQVTFDPNSAWQTIGVQLLNDNILENTEYFVGMITSSSMQRGVLIGQNTMSVNVVDDDTVTVEIADAEYSITEDGVSAVITIRKNGLITLPISIILTTIDGSAVAPSDYTAVVSAAFVLSAEMRDLAVMIPVVNDRIREPLESFSVAISLSCNQSGVLLGQSLATVVINDEDTTTVGLEMAEYTVLEAAGSVSVRVTMRGNSSDVVTVMFNTISQTATAQSDYTSVMTEICFPPGTSEKTVVVPVLNDNLHEPTIESFLVSLSLPTGQTRVQLNQDTATVRIEDDDVVTIEFQSMAYVVSEGSGSVSLVVVKRGSSTSTIAVELSTVNSSALVQREVMFNPDTFTQTVIVSIQNDQMLELPESFAVELQIATNLPRIQIGQNNRSIVTIIEASGPSCPSCLSCPSCPTQAPTDATGIVIDMTTTSMLPTIPSTVDTGGLNTNDCRAFGSVNVISAVIAVLIAIIIILVIVVLVLVIVVVKNKKQVKLLYGTTAGDAFGVTNNVYEEVRTPSHTATAVTFGQTTFDGHETEDPYAKPKNVTEKDPESGQFVGHENETTEL